MFTSILHNETQKIFKRRLAILLLAVTAVVIMMTFGEFYLSGSAHKTWQDNVNNKIADYQRIVNGQAPSEWEGKLPTPDEAKMQIQVLQYHLDNNIPINGNDAGWFVADTINKEMALLMVLLIAYIAAETLAQESGEGTIKLLMTTPVSRWQVTLGKYIGIMLTATIVLAYTLFLGYLADGILYGFGSLSQPVILSPKIINGSIDMTASSHMPLWQYILSGTLLNWLSLACVGGLGMLFSALLNNSGAAIGATLGTVIGGQVGLGVIKATWPNYLFWKYLTPASNLPIDINIPSGTQVSVAMAVVVLIVWALIFITSSMFVFEKKDILA
ncbi:MAG: type transport system permease protein [Clostridiales bacterium]|jgi:ABC-2 type transport system permease protein|nr:type transport system permease protein [Clostridiales bacterium]